MSEPIYKFFRGRFLPDWYQLSKEEQESILAKLTDALAKLGAKRVLLCRTYWSTDEWLWAGVEEFPNIEAVQKYMETSLKLDVWGGFKLLSEVEQDQIQDAWRVCVGSRGSVVCISVHRSADRLVCKLGRF